MTHCITKPMPLFQRFLLWLFSLVEHCIYAVLPRGPLRRRLRDRIDSMLTFKRSLRVARDLLYALWGITALVSWLALAVGFLRR
jgi:hypothetical protein